MLKSGWEVSTEPAGNKDKFQLEFICPSHCISADKREKEVTCQNLCTSKVTLCYREQKETQSEKDSFLIDLQ